VWRAADAFQSSLGEKRKKRFLVAAGRGGFPPGGLLLGEGGRFSLRGKRDLFHGLFFSVDGDMGATNG